MQVREEQKIHVQQAKCSPRGTAAAARLTMEPDVPPTTLYRMFHYDRATFSAGLDCITSYMRRNSSMEVQKAIAITLIGTAMLVWVHNITKAAELSADVVRCLTNSENGSQSFYDLSDVGATQGDGVILVRKPHIPRDSNCVTVFLCGGAMLSHVAKEAAERLSPMLLGPFRITG